MIQKINIKVAKKPYFFFGVFFFFKVNSRNRSIQLGILPLGGLYILEITIYFRPGFFIQKVTISISRLQKLKSVSISQNGANSVSI